MRTLTVSLFSSLDGVMQAPGGPNEDLSGGFRLGGWIVPFADPAIGENLQQLLAKPFELLLGRRTYDIFASHWPHVAPDTPSHALAEKFNAAAKHVATHRQSGLDWHNSHALDGELPDAVRALKTQEGADLLTFGSGDMVRQLLAAGLVDELSLLTFPVMLGRGRRLFDDNAEARAFELTHMTRTPGGVVIARYARAGEVRTGSFNEPGRT
ncbi:MULTISPECIES: dihydrofolate reductase family protein [unclassified Caballeronia]|uniref:dihydrofolate reductase family protein n=1 Tax=unclassified Caballeronia TaxID=2646786 RepID=UPI0028667876|nr:MULTISPECIES: dihydrofolate reductase family protein [unclassified Caballeronia]MDR5816966.1 dihydrofolate reductase family protein [Caballeronia sp. LZ033]MDR5823874.1 dihydrofolate reductase family protein [Caballeronia sp. LZ043]